MKSHGETELINQRPHIPDYGEKHYSRELSGVREGAGGTILGFFRHSRINKAFIFWLAPNRSCNMIECDGLVRNRVEVDPELMAMASLGSAARDALQQKLLDTAAIYGPLYSRKCLPTRSGEQAVQAGRNIVVKQFNLLAEGLSAPPWTAPPFPAEEVACLLRIIC